MFIKETDVKTMWKSSRNVVGFNECLINASKNLLYPFVMNYIPATSVLRQIETCKRPRSDVSSVDLAVDYDH